MPLTEATVAAEVSDLMAKLANVADDNLKQAIQDRIDFIQQSSGRAPVYGLARAVTKGTGGRK